MDPLTQWGKVAELSLELIIRIYDDTPKERRIENIEKWYEVLDGFRKIGDKLSA